MYTALQRGYVCLLSRSQVQQPSSPPKKKHLEARKKRHAHKKAWKSCPRANHNVVTRAGIFQNRLGGSGGGDRLRDLRDLVTCPDDFLALVIFRVLNVFVLFLCPFPNLNLATATNDANTHGRE